MLLGPAVGALIRAGWRALPAARPEDGPAPDYGVLSGLREIRLRLARTQSRSAR